MAQQTQADGLDPDGAQVAREENDTTETNEDETKHKDNSDKKNDDNNGNDNNGSGGHNGNNDNKNDNNKNGNSRGDTNSKTNNNSDGKISEEEFLRIVRNFAKPKKFEVIGSISGHGCEIERVRNVENGQFYWYKWTEYERCYHSIDCELDNMRDARRKGFPHMSPWFASCSCEDDNRMVGFLTQECGVPILSVKEEPFTDNQFILKQIEFLKSETKNYDINFPDLVPQNMLYDKTDNTIKLCDFDPRPLSQEFEFDETKMNEERSRTIEFLQTSNIWNYDAKKTYPIIVLLY